MKLTFYKQDVNLGVRVQFFTNLGGMGGGGVEGRMVGGGGWGGGGVVGWNAE